MDLGGSYPAILTGGSPCCSLPQCNASPLMGTRGRAPMIAHAIPCSPDCGLGQAVPDAHWQQTCPGCCLCCGETQEQAAEQGGSNHVLTVLSRGAAVQTPRAQLQPKAPVQPAHSKSQGCCHHVRGVGDSWIPHPHCPCSHGAALLCRAVRANDVFSQVTRTGSLLAPTAFKLVPARTNTQVLQAKGMKSGGRPGGPKHLTMPSSQMALQAAKGLDRFRNTFPQYLIIRGLLLNGKGARDNKRPPTSQCYQLVPNLSQEPAVFPFPDPFVWQLLCRSGCPGPRRWILP